MTDTQTDEFLAHFGVKGMHWGVRHQPQSTGGGGRSGGGSSSGGSSRGGSSNAAPAQRTGLSRNKKIAIGVGAAAVVALGTAAVIYNMKTGGKLPVNALKAASDLKGSAFKAANGGFDRAKAIGAIASREARAVPSTARVLAKGAAMKGGEIGRDIGGVARTSGQGVSRLAGAARLQGQLGAMELRSRGGVAGVAGAAARGVAGNAAGAGRSVARDLQGLSETGRATFSRIYGEQVVSRVMANSEIASARLGDLKSAAKGVATGVAGAAGNARLQAQLGSMELRNGGAARIASGAVRKAAGTAGAAIAKSGPQALANYQFRKITKGM